MTPPSASPATARLSSANARLAANARQCHRCGWIDPCFAARKCRGPCACTLNGRDITQNIQANFCPAGRFGWSGPGDVLAWLMYVCRVKALVHRWHRLWRTRCNCDKRQDRLNRWWKRVLETARR